MNKSRKKRSPAPMTDSGGIKDFLDMIAPSVIDFKVDHFLCGNTAASGLSGNIPPRPTNRPFSVTWVRWTA